VEKHALSTLAVQQLTVSAGGASNPTFDDFFFKVDSCCKWEKVHMDAKREDKKRRTER